MDENWSLFLKKQIRVEWHTNHVKEKAKSTITADSSSKSRHKPIFRERYELFLLKRKQLGNSLQTTKLKLKSNVEFLISAELNTAVDSDVGYDGAEFNSVLFPVSRNYCLSNMDKGFYK